MGFCLNKLQEGAFDERIELMTGSKSLRDAKVVEIRDNFGGRHLQDDGSNQVCGRDLCPARIQEEVAQGQSDSAKGHRDDPGSIGGCKDLRAKKGYAP